MENLTRCGKVLLEKRIDLQLVNKFCTFYGTWRFITIFKTNNCPYPKPSECNPHLLILFKLNFNIILPSMPRSSKHSLPSHFPPKSYTISLLPYTCPAHPPWCDHHKNIWSGANTVKLHTVHSSLPAHYFHHFGSIYLPQNPQSMFLPYVPHPQRTAAKIMVMQEYSN